jgi:hypothetical protein
LLRHRVIVDLGGIVKGLRDTPGDEYHHESGLYFQS